MGLEEIRARLDTIVAAGSVPPNEREFVRAQVDEIAAVDPAGADRYRTELAQLDPRLFPPPDATALTRLLRSVRPWRPVIGRALALIPERDVLRLDLETLWEQTREARARYQVPSQTEILRDGSPTMLICERLILARMKETGLERKNIAVVVAGHDGVSAEVGVWLKLGVTVVAVEIDVCNGALKTSLEEQGIDVSRLILKPIESRDIPKGDIVLWNFPGMTDRYIWEYPAVMGNPLKPGGILVVQTENRGLEWQLEFSLRWKTLLVDSRITASNLLLPSRYLPGIFDRATLLILKNRSPDTDTTRGPTPKIKLVGSRTSPVHLVGSEPDNLEEDKTPTHARQASHTARRVGPPAHVRPVTPAPQPISLQPFLRGGR